MRLHIVALSFVLLPTLASANVDISTKIYIPQIDGMSFKGTIPNELTDANAGWRADVSLSNSAMELLLQRVGLPGVNDVVSKPVSVPQCQETSTTVSGTFQITLDDAAWLRSRGAFCRLSRKLFGGCKPKSVADLLSHGSFGLAAPEQVSAATSVSELDSDHCVSDAPDSSYALHSILKKCVDEGSAAQECLSQLGANPFLSQKLEKTGATWSVTYALRASHVERQKLPARVDQQQARMVLASMNIDNFLFVQDGTGQWESKLIPDVDFLATYFTKAPSSIAIYAVYQNPSSPDEDPVVRKGVLPGVSYATSVIGNLRREVVLKPSDVEGYEVLDDSNEFMPTALAIRNICQSSDADQFSGFGKFICDKEPDYLVRMLARHTEVRIKFRDQNGVLRVLTWEHPARASTCTVSDDGTSFSCKAGHDVAAWLPWSFDPSDELLAALRDRPSSGAVLDFKPPVSGYLRRADSVAPLEHFEEPNSRNISTDGLLGNAPST